MSRFVSRPSARVALVVPLFLMLAVCGVYAWQEGGNPELADQMSVMRRSMRGLRRSIDKPEMNAKSIEMVVAMQDATQKAKAMEPTKAKGMEGAKKTKFVAEYRAEMIDLQKVLLDFERHLVKGDNKKARKVYDGLKDIQSKAHEKFQN